MNADRALIRVAVGMVGLMALVQAGGIGVVAKLQERVTMLEANVQAGAAQTDWLLRHLGTEQKGAKGTKARASTNYVMGGIRVFLSEESFNAANKE